MFGVEFELLISVSILTCGRASALSAGSQEMWHAMSEQVSRGLLAEDTENLTGGNCLLNGLYSKRILKIRVSICTGP